MPPDLSDLLFNALAPVGKTLYVWGGGWNEEDTGSGVEARSIGLSDNWKKFFDAKARPDYDYRLHRYRIHDGLDCSGYIGWTVYNTLESQSGGEGYVTSASRMANALESRGFGYCLPAKRSVFSLPGDIVSMPGHVYLSLGCADDGSVLLLHASPPGISFCGTSQSSKESMADALARQVMEQIYPSYASLFPYRSRDHETYTANSTVFRFYESVLTDKAALRQKHPAALIAHLFPDLKSIR